MHPFAFINAGRNCMRFETLKYCVTEKHNLENVDGMSNYKMIPLTQLIE